MKKAERIFKKSISLSAVLIAGAIFSSALFADSSYIVKKGDTLYSISRKYQITVAELRTANNLSETDVLKEGFKLVIPSADIRNAAALSVSQEKTTESSASVKTETKASEVKNNQAEIKTQIKAEPKTESKIISFSKTYEVQKGDTLYGISRKFDVRLAELLSENNLDSNGTIKVGQKLKIPGSADNSVAQKTSSSENSSTIKNNSSQNSSAASKNSINTASNSSQSSSSEKTTEKTTVAQVKTASPVQITSAISWPLSNPTVKKVNGKVSGVLLTGKANEKVTAVREGTVMYTGVYRGFGEVVFVQSKTGLIYSYSGLGKVTCKKGDYVVNGTELGTTSKDDSSIKFMVFQNGMPIDPYKAPRG